MTRGASESAGETVTRLVDEVVRLAGAFLAEGDAMTAPFGLTAARWLVLGALADEPVSVSEVARRRGLSRQSVRESAARLERDGLVVRVPDPADARAPRLALTPRAREALDDLEPVRVAWAGRVAAAVGLGELATTLATLRTIRAALTGDPPDQIG
jgi:DNA-binding MarR family transcriptional regulator